MLRRLLYHFLDGSNETARLRKTMCRLLRDHVHDAANLLDIGCADGIATQLYADIWNIPSVKVSTIEPQGEYARLLPFANHAVDIERDRFPFSDQSFDLVICNQVLEHLKVLQPAVSEMVRVLRIEGYLAIGVPNLSALVNRLLLLVGKDPICLVFPGPHFRAFSYGSFLRFLIGNKNLTLIGVSGSSLYPLPPWLSERVAPWIPSLSCYTFFLLKKLRHDPIQDWTEVPYISKAITG